MADTELKIAEFFENEDRDYEKLVRSVQLWYSYVKDNITVVSAARSAHKENEYLHDWRRSIVVQYVSNSISEPAKCTHENTFHQITDATCVSYGEDALMCSDCGYVLSVTQIAKTDHEYEWVNNNNQTCTVNGTRTGTCKMCNGTRIETIPDTATGHNIVWTYNEDATCLLDGTETATCRNGCNFNLTRIKEGSALGHDWSDYSWVNDVEPNCETTATKMRYCKRPACGIVESETCDKLAHNWVPNMDGTHTCTNGCGVTEECNPLGPGEICDKCAYTVNVNWEIVIKELASPNQIVDGEIRQPWNIDSYTEFGLNYDVPGIEYSLTGDLPSSMALENNCLQSFANEAGYFNFTIIATDPSGKYFTDPISKDFVLHVYYAGPEITLTRSGNIPDDGIIYPTTDFFASYGISWHLSNTSIPGMVAEYTCNYPDNASIEFLESTNKWWINMNLFIPGTYEITIKVSDDTGEFFTGLLTDTIAFTVPAREIELQNAEWYTDENGVLQMNFSGDWNFDFDLNYYEGLEEDVQWSYEGTLPGGMHMDIGEGYRYIGGSALQAGYHTFTLIASTESLGEIARRDVTAHIYVEDGGDTTLNSTIPATIELDPSTTHKWEVKWLDKYGNYIDGATFIDFKCTISGPLLTHITVTDGGFNCGLDDIWCGKYLKFQVDTPDYTCVGTTTITITATDPSGEFFATPMTKTYTVTVVNPYADVEIVDDISNTSIYLGDDISFNFEPSIPVPSGSMCMMYDGNIPSGLSMQSVQMTIYGVGTETLKLVGTPDTEGTYQFTVKIQMDPNGVYFAPDTVVATNTYKLYVLDPNATITFVCTEGTASESSRVVTKGSLIGDLPTATPSDASKIFLGWYTAASGGLKVNESYAVSTNITLYARFVDSNSGQDDVDVEFGEATSAFNISFNGDRTNYSNNNYTIYHQCVDGTSDSLVTQTGIWSSNGTNSMSASNPEVKFYMKVTNNGESGVFDIGYDADSYVVDYNNDKVNIKRLSDDSFAFMKNGSNDSTTAYTVTIPHPFVLWAGQYSARTSHRWDTTDDPAVGSYISGVDSGFACTIKNIYIPANSYTILEIDFKYYTGE